MNEYQQSFVNLENRINRRLSFLEFHYIRHMESGGDHVMYVVGNDIDDDKKLCNQLKKIYQEYQGIKKEV